MVLSKRLAALIAFFITGNVEAYSVTTMEDFIKASKGCNQLGNTTIKYQLNQNVTFVMSADTDPKGFCMLTVEPAEAAVSSTQSQKSSSLGSSSDNATLNVGSKGQTESAGGVAGIHGCPLSKDVITTLSSPKILAEIQTRIANSKAPLSPAATAALRPFRECLRFSAPLPPMVKPPVAIIIPPGAVPAGTPLPLPSGITVTPGTLPPGTPPGTYPTAVNPALLPSTTH